MGGQVAVTIREENGTIHKLETSTRNLGWMIDNMKMLNKDPEHIKNIINKNVNIWGMIPDMYGIVVIDLMTDHIISCQGYCRFGVMYATELSKYMEDREEPLGRLREFFDAKKIKACSSNDTRLPNVKLYMPSERPKTDTFPANNFKKFISFLDNHDDRLFINFDMSPFTVIQFAEDYKKCLQEIKKLGFTLTPNEQGEWESWIREQD